MEQGRMWKSLVWLATLLLGAALISRYTVGPAREKIPQDYQNQINLISTDQYRISPQVDWQNKERTGTWLDRAISSSRDIRILQSELTWDTGAAGEILSRMGEFGVDSHTRQNVAGFGDAERYGQFLFSPHTQKTTYFLWNLEYPTPFLVNFLKEDVLDGLSVYVFCYQITGMDETSLYTSMVEIPDQPRVVTDSGGTIWVEPVTGTVVDLEDHGASAWADPITGKPEAEFHRWNTRMAPESRIRQAEIARKAAADQILIEERFPCAAALVGILLGGIGLIGRFFR